MDANLEKTGEVAVESAAGNAPEAAKVQPTPDSMIQRLADELGQSKQHVANVITLLDEGNTVPFIARYRKEMHGAMDDQLIRQLADRLQYLRNLLARKEEVKNSINNQRKTWKISESINNQGKLTEELAAAIDKAETLAEVEDLYRPYKQKRRTRATVAREKGLEPLAEALFAQGEPTGTPEQLAEPFVDAEKGVETVKDALQGASDIIAENISDDAEIR